MTFAELKIGTVFTWRDRFPDHMLMQKTGDNKYEMLRILDAGAPLHAEAFDCVNREDRVFQWTRTKESMK